MNFREVFYAMIQNNRITSLTPLFTHSFIHVDLMIASKFGGKTRANRYLAVYSLSGHVHIYQMTIYDLVSTITLKTPSVKVLSIVFDPVVDED
uniref:Uncharacterized protein n=1 Tax=Panagrolaimus sp. JU765 TaxID=591449 RepID=A0AC34R3P3_9BILA